MADQDDDVDVFDDWEEDGDEDVTVKSLFSAMLFPSVKALLAHDRETYGFDLCEAAAAVQYDDIALIMLVNFIRRRVEECNVSSSSSIASSSNAKSVDSSFIEKLKLELTTREFLQDDTNMIPILNDDPVLFLLRDALVEDGIITDENDEEEEAIEAQTAIAMATQQQEQNQDGTTAAAHAGREDMLKKYQTIIATLTAESDAKEAADDSYYFTGYSHISIHETMLRDHPRTSSYADALVANASFMKGKVVLDVGCGTGILSMLAVRAGAKKVIGVDLSSIIARTQKVIEKNGMSDVITLVRGRLEDVKLPLAEDEDVDVIVSEWMGYGLYFENMLSSVLYARDVYLSDSGVLMPSDAEIYIEAMTAQGADDRVAWWGDVYGFDMTDMADLLSDEAQVQLVDPDNITSDRSVAHKLHMKTASSADLDFETPFQLTIGRDSPLRAFVLSFDVIFAGMGFLKEVTLTTGVAADPTHWKQTVLWLTPENCSMMQQGDVIRGVIKYARGTVNARDYDITVTWRVESSAQTTKSTADTTGEKTQTFLLAA